MTEEFNKNLFFDNISFKLKETGKKIGELENEAGVSPGYISRTSKDGNTKPGIDFIMKVADALNISIDTLLKVDLTKLTPTELYLIAFLEKLLKDTATDKLDWKTETADYLNNRLETDINGYCYHPLFSYETFYEESETEYPDQVSRIVFPSNSFGVHTWINGDCFNLKMKNNTVLYFMNICKNVRHVRDEAYAKELWICQKDVINQYLCSSNDTSKISSLVEVLYSAVAENAKHPKVHKNIKNVIDAFMVGDINDDEDIPF